MLLCQNCSKDQLHQVCIGRTAVLGSQRFFLYENIFLGYINPDADIVGSQDTRETDCIAILRSTSFRRSCVHLILLWATVTLLLY